MTRGRSLPDKQNGEGAARQIPELAIRLASALVLAALALAATLYGPWTFLLLVITGGIVMSLEWDHLTRRGKRDGTSAIAAVTVVAATILVALGYPQFALGLLVASSAAIWFAGVAGAWTIAGLFYAVLPMAALVWLRSDPAFGLAAVLFVFAIAWTTDIASYGAGRLIGGAKLAPKISPNKTWSGFAGGVLVAALAGSIFAILLGGTSALALALVGFVVALACQAGDLIESAVKRHFGAKDASALIPGHGGLLDRVDGLLFAALMAALIALLRGPAHPGQALLLW